jgi:hypothetical protein
MASPLIGDSQGGAQGVPFDRLGRRANQKAMTVKKLLLVFLISICTIGWRSESIMQLLGLAKSAASPQTLSLESLTAAADKSPAGMSLSDFAELARTDPEAHRKLFQSHQQQAERSEVDKLINFFTRLKYE